MAQISEAQVESYLVKRVKGLGGEVRKVAWIGRQNAPDRFVMLPPNPIAFQLDGRSFFVEVKAPDADMNTPHVRAQLREHARMRALGVEVHVVDSFESVDEVLK